MFKLILEKELREIVGTTKFAVTFGVCAVLILLAFYVGARNYQVSRAEYDASIVENLRQMEGLTDWNQIEHRIFLKPQPLASLVSGVSNDIGRTVDVNTNGELRDHGSRFNEDPIFAVFRFLDLEFIFTIVLSLFAILFGYDAINGEKERGTLRLSFANSIPRDQYILGKIVGSFLALVVPLLVPILIGCLLLPILGVPMGAGEWMRLGMVILAGILYFGVFLTLSVFISAMTERSSSSFLMLLVVWIVAVLIVPRVSVLMAGRSVDVPSIDEVDYQKGKYSRQLFTDRMAAFKTWAIENPMGDDHRAFGEAIRVFNQEQDVMYQEKMDLLTKQLNEQRENKATQRQKLALAIARLSPAASFSLAAADLASTSLGLRASYLDAAKMYQTEYARFMKSKNAGDTGFRFSIHAGAPEEEPEPIEPDELPAFEYEQPDASETIAAALPDLGLLALFNIVFFAGAFIAFLRYDVR